MASPTNRVLWITLMVSLLIYVGVAYAIELPDRGDPPIAILFPVLAGMALAVGAGSLVYRRHALSGPIQSGRLDPSTPEGHQKAFQPFILNLVLSESVGIYGLVLAFLSGEPGYAVGFVAAALVLMFLHRPTAPDLVPPQSSQSLARGPGPIV